MTGGTSTVAVTTSTGQTVTSTPGTNTKVVDESGNVVPISKNGTATQGKYDKNAFGQGATNSEVAQAATDDKLPKVTLTLDTSKPYYGYDTSAGGEPWVSIQTGKSVSLTASVDLRKSSHKATDIRYRTNDGMVVDATGSNPATLTAKGLYSGTAIPILAVADTGKVDSLKTSFVCGKINTVGYDPEYRRVWLVPVNGAKVDKEAIAKKLSAVYRQAVVEWDVQCDPKTMSLTLTDEEMKGICKDITVGIASNYTIEQQTVLKKFGREPEERSYILFMVDGKAGDATGFMPLNRSAGFIYLQGQSTDAVARTVAHELGHGAFGLAHEGRAKDNTLAATDNLMDYSGGTALTKAQWDAIHSEYRRLKWFQGEDEGKALGDGGVKSVVRCLLSEDVLKRIAKHQYFYLPDGRIVDFKNYLPSGFYAKEDVTKEAHGAVGALRVKSYDYGLHYIEELHGDKTTKIVTGFGFDVGDAGKFITEIKVKELIVGDNFAKEAVRVYVDKQTDKVSVSIEKNGVIIDSFPVEKTECGCTYLKEDDLYGTTFFKTDKVSQKYVSYWKGNSKKVNETLHDDEELLSRFVKLVKNQKKGDKTGVAMCKQLEDKLNSYEIANNRRFVVVTAEISTLSTSQAAWNAFAKEVFEKSELPEDAVLVTIPYINCKGIGVDGGDYYYMPGVAKGGGVDIQLNRLRTDYDNTQRNAEVLADKQRANIWTFVKDLFASTSKKYYQRYYYITAKGEILGRELLTENHVGFVGTYDYRLVCDGRFKQYASQLKTIAGLFPEKGKPYTELQSQGLIREQKKLEEFFTANPTPADLIVNHGMNELAGTSNLKNCVTFAQWYRDRIYHQGQATPSPADACFYLGRNQVEYDEALQSIDMLGMVLAPFAFDWVADMLGCAYAGYYADFSNASIYSSGILIPVMSAGSIKGLTKEMVKALRGGKAELVKENGEAVIRLVKGSVNQAENLFDLSVLKKLTGEIPGGVNKTNIGKTLFDKALKFKPTSGTQKTLLDDILANGDNAIDGVASGYKTETLVDDIFQTQGYTKLDGKYFGDGSNGFDNVFIKGSIDNPSEIIIIECKQMKSKGNVVLNSPSSTGLPAQMSDDWIEYIAQQKLLNIGGDKTILARKILNSQQGFIQKYVVAVDKTAGEINFLKLGNY